MSELSEPSETPEFSEPPDLPAHTDTGPAAADPAIAATSPRRRIALVLAGVALVVVVVVLHATGVIEAGGH